MEIGDWGFEDCGLWEDGEKLGEMREDVGKSQEGERGMSMWGFVWRRAEKGERKAREKTCETIHPWK